MTVTLAKIPEHEFFCLSTDTKPTGVDVGSRLIEIDTLKEFACYDGTNWIQRLYKPGLGDPISDLPVFVDFEHHQVHEGESYLAEDAQTGIGASTVQYGFTVATYALTIRGPHLLILCDVYNGNCLVQLYESATFTGGSAMTAYNRNRNSATTAGSSVKTGVTSSNGTLIKSFYAGGGKTTSALGRSESEMVLKSNTIYRIDVIGQAANTAAIVGFLWYEDLGV